MVIKLHCPRKMTFREIIETIPNNCFAKFGEVNNDYAIFIYHRPIKVPHEGRAILEEEERIPIYKADMEMRLRGVPFRTSRCVEKPVTYSIKDKCGQPDLPCRVYEVLTL